MKNEDSKFISIALILSVLGWLLYGCALFVGLSLCFRETLSVITVTASAMVLSALALFFAVRAKKTFSRSKGWTVTQYISLAGLLLILGASVLPISYAVNYAREYKALSQAARQEINALQSTYHNFQTQENGRLSNTVTGLQHYVDSRSYHADQTLTDYLLNTMGQQPNTVNQTSINNLNREKGQQISDVRIGMRSYKNGIETNLHRFDSLASSQNPAAIRELRHTLPGFATDMAGKLTAVSNSLDLPTITTTGTAHYTAIDNRANTYEFTPVSLEEAWSKVCIFTWQGAVGAVIIIFLVLFIYILTYPPMQGAVTKGPKRSDAHGLPL